MANEKNESNIIIYNTIDGKASVELYAHDGSVWMNQNQLAELFDTLVSNVAMYVNNVRKKSVFPRNTII